MKRTRKPWNLGALPLLLAAVMLLPAAQASGQGPVQVGPDQVELVSPFLFVGDLRDLPTAPAWRPGDPIKEIPRRHFIDREPPGAPANPTGLDRDPLLALQEAAAPGTEAVFGTPDLNFAGQGFTGVNPPDTVGDVGTDYYIQMINASSGAIFTVYDKDTGALVAGPTFLDTLGSGFCASGLGDPIVLYDQLAGRWLLSEFSNSGNRLCVYISQTGDPITGGWYAYDFQAPSFPDYPKYAVWPDAYYVSSNESSPAQYALERSQMLVGGTAAAQRFTAPDLGAFGFQATTPSDLDGSTPPPPGSPHYFIRHNDDEAHNPGGNDPVNDFLEIFELSVDFATPANSTFTGPFQVPIADIDSELCGFLAFNCFPQPGTSVRLDPLREVVMWRSTYRNEGSHETLVGNLVTDVDGTDRGGVRWYELRRSGGSWSVFQEGTYSPDGNSRFMGAAAMDGSGNIAVGYNVSSSATFPSLRYSGRLASDPAGTLPQGENNLVSGSASNASNRYGDYSSLNVDPVDDCTFWFTGEYNATSQWSTRIGRFAFAGCGGTCGNGVIEGNEVCDLADLGGETCATQGCTGGGTLVCLPDCSGFDTSGCFDCPACNDNGICEAGEDCLSCPNDCVSGTTSGAACGNGVCEAGDGEDCLSCPADCNGVQNGKPANRFCCGDGDGQNPVPCSDPRCSAGGVTCTNVPQPPGSFCCGDDACDAGEDCANCALDCTLGAEDCTNGADDDCDGFVDCDDSECSGLPICEPVDCSQFTNKKPCNGQAGCRWDNKNKICVPQ